MTSSEVPVLSSRVISAKEIEGATEGGGSFVETPDYRVGLARREGPGEAEVHDVDTDIFHILDGSANLVTGGEMVEPRTVGLNEIRAGSITGGEEKGVFKGDVIVIPRTVPHWFKEVTKAPFVYLVVKSTAR